jgi:hypothetical protein
MTLKIAKRVNDGTSLPMPCRGERKTTKESLGGLPVNQIIDGEFSHQSSHFAIEATADRFFS